LQGCTILQELKQTALSLTLNKNHELGTTIITKKIWRYQ